MKTAERPGLGRIYPVGLTVSDLDASIRFYRDVLGLRYQGQLLMEGPETERMFQRPGCRARVAYLNGSEELAAPPVELIQFVDTETEVRKPELFRTSISELCFCTADADRVYRHLLAHQVDCLSEPQTFDFRGDGFGRSKAFYFRDPDSIVLEIMEPVPEPEGGK